MVANDSSTSESGGASPGLNSLITDTNFFDTTRDINCEFIYDAASKDQATRAQGGFGGLMSRIFNRDNMEPAEITSMCSQLDQIAIGFSNGVLIILDIDKMEIKF